MAELTKEQLEEVQKALTLSNSIHMDFDYEMNVLCDKIWDRYIEREENDIKFVTDCIKSTGLIDLIDAWEDYVQETLDDSPTPMTAEETMTPMPNQLILEESGE